MAKGFKHGAGGGAALNFKVAGGTERPADPKENTIWVNTGREITGWAFSATEPKSPEEGMVWFSVGMDSGGAFNALKKNHLQVYPVGSKQYISGAWEYKEGWIYQRGWTLLEYPTLFLVDEAGIKQVDLTTSSITGSQQADHYLFDGYSGGTHFAYTAEALDLTGYETMYINTIEVNTNAKTLYLWDKDETSFSASTAVASKSIISSQSTKTETTFDISAYSGEYILGFGWSNSNKLQVYSWYLE